MICIGLLQIWPFSFVPFLIYVHLFVGVDPIERWHTQLLVYNEGDEGFLFDIAVGDIEVSFEEYNCFICLGTDVADVIFPVKV